MKLVDAVCVIRSKNAGPLTLTIDLLFDDPGHYEQALAAASLTPAEIAQRYGVPVNAVHVTPYPGALSVKVVRHRKIGDRRPGRG